MRVTLVINGDRRELNLEPQRTLADVLHHDVGLTSTFIGCADGTCGACTVQVGPEAVRSCLMLAVQADGSPVRTAEGLAQSRWQTVLLDENDSPCRACIPGLVMLAAGAVAAGEQDPEQLRRLLAANVCRRAGHDKAQQAVIEAALRSGGSARGSGGQRRDRPDLAQQAGRDHDDGRRLRGDM